MKIKSLLAIMLLIGLAVGQVVIIDETVVVTPAQPTTKDSLRITLADAPGCCCSQYAYDSILQVTDTMIILSFTQNDKNCTVCMCPMILGQMRWLQYISKPLKAGRYGIYKTEIPYCDPKLPCLMMLPAPVRVGEVTVEPASGIVLPLQKGRIKPAESISAGSVICNVRGEIISNHRALSQRPAGAYFVRQNGKSAVRMQTGSDR